jgi:hypothetical protein
MSFIDSITIGTEVPDSSNSYILHSKRNFNDTDATNTLEHIEKDNLSSEMQTKTHSEKQKEVLELENTLFSTKNACKEWPIGFMIWPIEILSKGPWAHLVKIFPYHWDGVKLKKVFQTRHQDMLTVIRSLWVDNDN